MHKITSFFHSSSNTTNDQSYLQDRKPDTGPLKEKQKEIKDPFLKRILVVDDEPDVTLTFRVGLEEYLYDSHDNDNNKKTRFEVYTYNNPLEALSEFKTHFYDLLLTDVYMPQMSGLDFSQKIVGIDANIKVCFISAAEVNIEALREVYPNVSFGCFIKKPVAIEYLVKRLLTELD